MTRDKTIEILNRLVVLHNRSFVVYLSDARPWNPFGEVRTSEVLRHIAADQRETVERLGELILRYHGVVQLGEYPMSFTDKHDLSIDYLLNTLIEEQNRLIETIDRCAADLSDDPVAQAAALESLGAAKAHLESLVQLRQETIATG